MKHLLTLVLLCPMLVFTQVTEDFSDGNFTQNPVWTGNSEHFIINDEQNLQLLNSEAGLSTLSTPNAKATNCEWRIWVRLSFSPSANNNARIYLISDNPDLSGSLNGYFLQLGEAGGDDAIELFRQSGTEIFSVCRGSEALLASSFKIGLKIIRDQNNLWTILADPNGEENYQFQAEAVDDVYLNTQHFGIYCKYTSSNSSKFYFDDIYVGEIIVDNQPPTILQTEVLDDSSLKIYFDEVVKQNSAENISNYSVNNGIGMPLSAEINPSDATQVILNFANKFPNGQENILTVSSVEDLSGNAITTLEIGFVYFTAAEYDVLINEIMADPSPSVNLPEYEYLELYNNLPHPINLNGWTLIVGSSEKVFNNVELDANSYLIVAKNTAQAHLEDFGNFYGFESFTLTNSGQDLVLISKEGSTISSVSYSDEWYGDHEKEDGGWSLEQINPENICSGAENWKASTDNKGGSPGSINSVISDLTLFPKPIKFEMLDAKNIQLTFNQKMDSLSLCNPLHYYVDNNIASPTSIIFSYLKPQKIILGFNDDFVIGKTYELNVEKQIQNCCGMEMKKDTTIVFGLPEPAENMDIVINEILFNPLGDGVDFVELFNVSFKVIDLSELELGSVKISPPNPPDSSYYSLTEEQLLMVPGAYLCLSSSPLMVKTQYQTNNPNGFLKVDPFPGLKNDKGSVLLRDKNSLMIDAFDYDEKMHYPLLVYVDGVSLERAVFLQTTNDKTNWHSAAESVGFATPAYENSQSIGQKETDERITVDPEIFSPDNDGYNDLVNISYNLDQAGYMMTIDIFNSNGYPVRKLVNNQYLGLEGSVNWDGIQDDNSKAAVGIYVIYVQLFDLDGNIKHFKRLVVLAAKL
jgi:hypothetical protein